MTITHHPSDETLAAFASGTLDEARSIVVAAHVSLCARCRATVHALEQIGGAMVERAEPAPLRAEAIEAVMSRLDSNSDVSARPHVPKQDYPLALSPYDVGPWRRIGRGLYWRKADVYSQDGTRVFMLKAAPGTWLPHHRHAGTEWTCVLAGAFHHDLGRYGPGDFDEADESVEHRPFVEQGATCVCLVALQGGLKLQGWIGRLLQPFVRL
ncbi:MAG: ChrR family anti-sigma-E factor [Xanthobacteraceae bacterium]|nr:ChrR family anti-sigma-E factor [Xanthobacteraceae bacterium]